MKRLDLEKMTVGDLVARFADIGVDQDHAILVDDNAKFSRLYWQMDAVEEELKSRDGDQRKALLRLYDHPGHASPAECCESDIGSSSKSRSPEARGHCWFWLAASW